ncbi:tRNA 5-methylaminomethyl-2-thiouridine biosynthesis bifunctional protein MnmC [Microbacterium laevaniformans]|uniref:tRNA 5-methylaminomethyl-2-thiouridine biosynthesis bifunctional protein MnmC n=1 Tax=Microbacterium laevaniformans TaxID=36807 RepID=A0A150HI71_9MICO|nr:FAD-dependent oxidoreductase [Microbacterium laevaniformans]KXZ61310.1 tRNA 5-methylaminomethyl-2-thiouridine biosynthesis bifunctional protein MnmC [Microbacterium laevaniformans]
MHDVVVIGAGLAGLRCAVELAERGLEVVVLEAADEVGGRQRTDLVEGFRLDRGFQVLNPAYPALRRSVDLDALAMRTFPVGVQVRTDRGLAELRHPLRSPLSIPRTLASGLVNTADAVAFARWLTPAFTRRLPVRARDDRSLRKAWDAAGLRGPLRTAVLEPFLAGVVAEADGATSSAFVQELVRYFALGRPGLPAQGIAAMPAQLAARARAAEAEIRLGARADRIDKDGPIVEVGVAGGAALRAGRVVGATGPESVAELAPVPQPATNGLQTWWFAAAAAPSASALLRVDGRGVARRGPIVNTAVVSHTAPSYAPAGRHLIEATCLLPRGGVAAGEDEVRRHLAELWDAEASGWELLRRDDIPDALPAQPAPLRAPRRPRVTDRVYVAGDHRDAASIQGALASGERAARAVVVDAGV